MTVIAEAPGADTPLRRLSPKIVVITVAPSRCMSGQFRRASHHTPRRRKLSLDDDTAIRALAATRSLRSLAAEFGVSHETIRTVVRRRETDLAAASRPTLLATNPHDLAL